MSITHNLTAAVVSNADTIAGITYLISDVDKTTSTANIVITWGTAIIVGYGVFKILLNILWHLFFGKKFEFKIGLLDMLLRKIKPVKIQGWADMDEEELDKTAYLYAAKIKSYKKQRGGVRKMGFFKNLWNGVVANKQTILGVGAAVAGAGLVIGGVIQPETVLNLIQGQYTPEGLMGIAVLGGTAGLAINGVIGKGVETPTEYKERVEIKKAHKAEVKEAKADGTLEAEKTKAKLMKDFGLTEDKAEEIVAAKKAEAKKALDAEVEAEKVKKAEKLAKQLGISVEDAKGIIAKQNK